MAPLRADQNDGVPNVKEKWKIVERIEYDFNLDGKKDSLTLSIDNDWNDPGDYIFLSIKIDGEPEFKLGNIYE